MKFLDSYFHLSEKGTNVRTEIIAGITTFLAMAYILGVNPMILSDAGMDIESVFTATALSCSCRKYYHGYSGQLSSRSGSRYGCQRFVRLHNLWSYGLQLGSCSGRCIPVWCRIRGDLNHRCQKNDH